MKKLILLSLCLLLTGCFNYTELNKMAIVSSIGVDKIDGKYEITVQIMNAKENKDTEGSQVTIYSEKSNTLIHALRNISLKSPRKLNGSHIGKIILSKEVAEENIIDVLDIFLRLSDAREEINVIVSDNISAKKVLSILTTTENIPSEYVRMTLESGYKNTSLTYPIKADEFISSYLKKYSDPVVPIIKIENYDKKGTTTDNINTTNQITKIKVIDKLGITKNGRIIDYMDNNEVYGYNFLNNNIKNSIIEIKCDKNNYSAIAIKSNTKYKTNKNNNKYSINITINVDGEINEYTCNNKINTKNLEKKLKKKINNYIESILLKNNNIDSDFLELKRKVYLDNKSYNNEQINVNYKINVNINKKGQLNNSIKGEKNE